MSGQTHEKAFEAYSQAALAARGWQAGSVAVWDKQRAIFPAYVLAFIQATQPTLWQQMATLHGEELSAKLIEAMVKERDTKGTLHVVRHGFKFYGRTFKLAFFKPAHGLNKDTLELFEKNTLHVTRQIPCHLSDGSTVDVVLSLNGIPIATMELKNQIGRASCRERV